MREAPPVYKCVCGKGFTPTHWPYTRRCPCGAEMTVNKPMRLDPIAFATKTDEIQRGTIARERGKK